MKSILLMFIFMQASAFSLNIIKDLVDKEISLKDWPYQEWIISFASSLNVNSSPFVLSASIKSFEIAFSVSWLNKSLNKCNKGSIDC